MFTGLISDVGEVIALGEVAAGRRFTIACRYPATSIPLGASIACDGACMTAVTIAEEAGRTLFTVDVSPESLSLTTLSGWDVGTLVNLERSLKAGDEMGGHIVTGHVDGLARITDIREEGDFFRFDFAMPAHLAKFVAAKGSVALNGTSLTVNTVSGDSFSVQLIPHTLSVTNWHKAKVGDAVNMEVDLMARYAARLLETASINGKQ